jgi:hypothetical protein
MIYGIDWHNPADTDNLLYRLAYVSRYQYAQPINTARTPVFWLSSTVAAATVLTESNCSDQDYSPFEVFSTFFIIFLRLFAMICIDLDFCNTPATPGLAVITPGSPLGS